MDKIYKDGLAPDPRTEAEKAKDYLHADLAGDVLVTWTEKPQWKKYVPREQDGSLSCVGQACAKAFEILGKGIESAHPIYRSRSNFPDGGMWLQNAGEICKKVGTTTEVLDTSQSQNETQMNRPIAVSTPTKVRGYITIQPYDIDKIAEAIELYKQCLLIFHCNKSEWTAIPAYNGNLVEFGHCVCAVDYSLYQGKKVLVIEDSTGHFNTLDGNGVRLITEDFLLKRGAGAMYLTPQVDFIDKTLRFGMTDPQVKILQEILKKDGEFPIVTNTTFYFGKITLGAVKAFQTKHGLVSDGICGPKTNAILNSL